MDTTPNQGVLSCVDAERSVLSACLSGGTKVLTDIDELVPDDFELPAHAVVYSAIQVLWAGNGLIDTITVSKQLTATGELGIAGGMTALTDLESLGASFANASHHAAIILAASAARHTIQIARSLASEVAKGKPVGDLISRATSALTDLANKGERGGPQHIKEYVKQVTVELDELRKSGKKPGVTTGFLSIDEWIVGLRAENYLLMARPSMGKTLLGMQFCMNYTRACGKSVLVYTMEQSGASLIKRSMANEGMISANRLTRGELTGTDYAKLSRVIGELSGANVWIDETGRLSVAQMGARAHKIQAKHGLGMIMVDYLQLCKPPAAGSREQEVSKISNELVALRKSLGIPLLVLSQLNRALEGRDDKKPRLSDLRDSGSLEQDADVVLGLWRPDQYSADDRPGEAHVEGLKGRNCGTGKTILNFEPELLRFSERTNKGPVIQQPVKEGPP